MKIKVLEVSDENPVLKWKFGDRVKVTKILVTIKHLTTQEVEEAEFDIEEIEKAAQLGLGLKKPLFETAKEIGIKNIVEELNKLAEKHGEFYKPDPLLISMQ